MIHVRPLGASCKGFWRQYPLMSRSIDTCSLIKGAHKRRAVHLVAEIPRRPADCSRQNVPLTLPTFADLQRRADAAPGVDLSSDERAGRMARIDAGLQHSSLSLNDSLAVQPVPVPVRTAARTHRTPPYIPSLRGRSTLTLHILHPLRTAPLPAHTRLQKKLSQSLRTLKRAQRKSHAWPRKSTESVVSWRPESWPLTFSSSSASSSSSPKIEMKKARMKRRPLP